jgi:AraC-like DNA-binding protein
MNVVDSVFVFQLHNQADLKWHQRIHHHEKGEFEVHYFISGNGTFTNGNTRYTIAPGYLFITCDDVVHNITTSKEQNLTYYATLMVYDKDQQKMLSALSAKNPWIQTPNMRFFFEEIREKGLSKVPYLETSACYQMMGFLFALAGRTGKQVIHSSVDTPPIERSLKYMQDHLFEKLSLEQIASSSQLNPSYFIRLFKRGMHISPMAYFSKLQMEACKSLLEDTNLSIKQIAAQFDFCSEFYFSKRFKESTGTTPSIYRQTHTHNSTTLLGDEP